MRFPGFKRGTQSLSTPALRTQCGSKDREGEGRAAREDVKGVKGTGDVEELEAREEDDGDMLGRWFCGGHCGGGW